MGSTSVAASESELEKIAEGDPTELHNEAPSTSTKRNILVAKANLEAKGSNLTAIYVADQAAVALFERE